MTDETTTEKLAEIEGQAENTPATGYTPPEGWRVVRFGELLLPGDVWVNWEGTESRPDIQHGYGATASGGRYIRNIDIELQTVKAQLAAVKAELASVAADRQRLLIELDAAQQVPADSPELRQLRADLEQVTRERDQHLDSYQRIFGDLETIRETTKAETVEAIVEWLEPVRATIEAADNVQQTMRADNLACDIIRNLPGILRYVVGLNHPEEIE